MVKTILAIETSCDETAIAVLEACGGLRSPRFRILKNTVSSQIEIHRPWGGVVPNLAKREHQKNLPILFNKLKTNKLKADLIAVTVGPGLEPALWTGINFAKEIHGKHFPGSALIGTNHLEGHLYSFLLPYKGYKPRNMRDVFPAIQLIVSGGHTILVLMISLTEIKILGETRDDAVGEAFDKVARMLHLPYPGGPEIERLANEAKKLKTNEAIQFPRPMINSKDYDFSFSGLKTSVLYHLRDNPKSGESKTNVAASFQKAAFDVLISKTSRAAAEFKTRSVILSGGVAANKTLRKRLSAACRRSGIGFISAPIRFQTDNAAMIAAAGYINHLKKKNRRLSAKGGMDL